MNLLLAGGAAAALAVTGLTGVIVSKNREEAGLRSEISRHLACDTALASSASLDVCPERIAEVGQRARRARACDLALAGSQAFMVTQSCSTEVMTVVATRDARARETATLSDTLASLRRDQAAAITRAEARGRTQTMRTNRAEDALAQAPVAAGGLGRCDADCLRNAGRD